MKFHNINELREMHWLGLRAAEFYSVKNAVVYDAFNRAYAKVSMAVDEALIEQIGLNQEQALTKQCERLWENIFLITPEQFLREVAVDTALNDPTVVQPLTDNLIQSILAKFDADHECRRSCCQTYMTNRFLPGRPFENSLSDEPWCNLTVQVDDKPITVHLNLSEMVEAHARRLFIKNAIKNGFVREEDWSHSLRLRKPTFSISEESKDNFGAILDKELHHELPVLMNPISIASERGFDPRGGYGNKDSTNLHLFKDLKSLFQRLNKLADIIEQELTKDGEKPPFVRVEIIEGQAFYMQRSPKHRNNWLIGKESLPAVYAYLGLEPGAMATDQPATQIRNAFAVLETSRNERRR